MTINYDTILDYIKEYFEAFNLYGQNPDTVRKMDEYFSPDFEFRPYVASINPVIGRADWYNLITSHPSGYERLTPEDILIDERRLVFAAVIKAEICDGKTREVLVTKRYFARYPMQLDASNKLKIMKLEFFWEVLPPGAMEIDDVFNRDWKQSQ